MKRRYIAFSVVGIVAVILVVGFFAVPPLIEDGAHCVQRGYISQIGFFTWAPTTHYGIIDNFHRVWLTVNNGTITDITGDVCLQIQDAQGKTISVPLSQQGGPAELPYNIAQNPTRWEQLTPPFNVTVYA